MTRTTVSAVVIAVVVGFAGAFLLQTGLAMGGAARIQPPWTVAVSLAVLAVLVVVLAIPIWRATHADERRPIDPFAATRTVLFAKAAVYLGAFVTGVGAAFVLDLVLRPVVADGDLLPRAIALLVAGAALLAAGLVAEQLCRVPPEDTDPPGAEEAG